MSGHCVWVGPGGFTGMKPRRVILFVSGLR
jgi:hypothetical protein